jgi:hypothetical protein
MWHRQPLTPFLPAFTIGRNRAMNAFLPSGVPMNPSDHNRLVLDFMATRAINVTDSVPVDTIMDYGIDRGLSLGEVEAALIHASTQEWILLVGSNVHLSQAGYAAIGPANDNSLSS